MKNKYGYIHQLIDLWRLYEEETEDPNFIAFGNWLKESEHKELSDAGDNTEYDKDLNSYDQTQTETDTQHRLLELFSRINRIQEFYTKRLFEGLPLSNIMEFNFLFSLNKHSSSRKKEIINTNLVEYSTGIDIIKRLIRLNLVDEFPDELDKRSKRLRITTEGKRVLIDALMVISQIGDLFFDPFNAEECDCCLKNLIRLETFHTKIMNKYNSASGFEILQIIEEQKK